MDNDTYGHVNNVVYYSYFDTIVNHFLIDRGGLDIHNSAVVGFVVASSCEYMNPISFPDKLEVGLRVDNIGSSSVRYGVVIYKSGKDAPCAEGTFTQVFVDRLSGKSSPIPKGLRHTLESIQLD
tara:strand:+ start:1829 stop:2200 length:372 start_codon:yes stop_codon:yes gene_type:complete